MPVTGRKTPKTKTYKLTTTLVDLIVQLHREGVQDAILAYHGSVGGFGQPFQRISGDVILHVESGGVGFLTTPHHHGMRHYLLDLASAGGIEEVNASYFGNCVEVRASINLDDVATRVEEERTLRALKHYATMQTGPNYTAGDFVRFKDFGTQQESQTPYRRPPFLGRPGGCGRYPDGSKLIVMDMKDNLVKLLISPTYGDPYIDHQPRELLEKHEPTKKPAKPRTKKTAGSASKLEMKPKGYGTDKPSTPRVRR